MKKIGIILGSLRKGSLNRKVAEALPGFFPEGYEAYIIPIDDLPLYNEDFESPDTLPESYAEFRKAVGEIDGVIFITPEYNRGTSGAMKNAVDVASRPYGQLKWGGLPAAVISGSPGRLGGYGANQQIRQTLAFFGMHIMSQPEMYLGELHMLLDENGAPNETLSGMLSDFTAAFVRYMERNPKNAR